MDPTDLLKKWRADEENLRRYGQKGTADVLRQCSEDLSIWCRERQLDSLTLDEAAEYSGQSYHTIQRKVAEGNLPNRGQKHRPRVPRWSLPARAPGRPEEDQTIDLAERVLRSRASS